MPDLNELLPLFVSLIGFPALVSAIVNVAKNYGWLADGSAPKLVGYLTLGGLVVTAGFFFTGNVPLLTQIDAQLGSLAMFLLTLATFVGELGLAKVYHAGLKGTPVIGKSYTYDFEQEQLAAEEYLGLG